MRRYAPYGRLKYRITLTKNKIHLSRGDVMWTTTTICDEKQKLKTIKIKAINERLISEVNRIGLGMRF